MCNCCMEVGNDRMGDGGESLYDEATDGGAHTKDQGDCADDRRPAFSGHYSPFRLFPSPALMKPLGRSSGQLMVRARLANLRRLPLKHGGRMRLAKNRQRHSKGEHVSEPNGH